MIDDEVLTSVEEEVSAPAPDPLPELLPEPAPVPEPEELPLRWRLSRWMTFWTA